MESQKTTFCAAIVLFLTGVVGCASSSSTPANNPGTGSLTLTVQATVSFDNFNNNGSGNSVNYSTDLRVDMSKGGQPVTGASVKMSTSLGTFPLTENPNNPGTYRCTYAGYSGFHTLFVVSGSDNVQGAQLAGPDIHTITFPAPNTTWGANKTMTTTWQRSMVAHSRSRSARATVPTAIQGCSCLRIQGAMSFPDSFVSLQHQRLRGSGSHGRTS